MDARGYFQPFGFELLCDDTITTHGLDTAMHIWAHFNLGSVRDSLGAATLPDGIPPTIQLFGSFDYFTPLVASVELTDACNAHCLYCYRDAGSNRSSCLSDWRTILSKLSSSGVLRVELTGGEPFCHPDILAVLESALRMFERVTILTNAFAFDVQVADAIGRLDTSKLAVQLDIDSTETSTHDRLRGLRGSHARAIAATRLLAERRILFRVAMNVVEANLEQVPDVCALSHSLGASAFVATPVLSMGRAKDGPHLPPALFPVLGRTLSQLAQRWGQFLRAADEPLSVDQYQQPPQCGAGKRRVAVAPNGDVRLCVLAPMQRFTFGNLLHDTLAGCMSTRPARTLSVADPPGASVCGTCDKLPFCWGCVVRPWLLSVENCRYRSVLAGEAGFLES